MKFTTALAIAFALAAPVALAGPAVDQRNAQAEARAHSGTSICAQRCRHEVQGRAALNYIATPRPATRD
jgi:hypothetical protein